MSKSRFLASLTTNQREELIRRLWDHQDGKCYISGEPIDLQVHEVDLDHIIALSRGGIDDESNIGLALAHYNRSKGVRDLEAEIDVEEWGAVRRGIKAIVGHKVWAETQKDLVSVLASTRQKDWARFCWRVSYRPAREEISGT